MVFWLGVKGSWEGGTTGHEDTEKVVTEIAKASGESMFLATGVDVGGWGAWATGSEKAVTSGKRYKCLGTG